MVPELTMKGWSSAPATPMTGSSFPSGHPVEVRAGGPEARGRVETFTVTGFELAGGRVRAVETTEDASPARRWSRRRRLSPEVAKLAGVELPNEASPARDPLHRALKPFLTPLVSVLDSGLYFSQSMRGEIVGGMGSAGARESEPGLRLRFLSASRAH